MRLLPREWAGIPTAPSMCISEIDLPRQLLEITWGISPGGRGGEERGLGSSCSPLSQRGVLLPWGKTLHPKVPALVWLLSCRSCWGCTLSSLTKTWEPLGLWSQSAANNLGPRCRSRVATAQLSVQQGQETGCSFFSVPQHAHTTEALDRKNVTTQRVRLQCLAGPGDTMLSDSPSPQVTSWEGRQAPIKLSPNRAKTAATDLVEESQGSGRAPLRKELWNLM